MHETFSKKRPHYACREVGTTHSFMLGIPEGQYHICPAPRYHAHFLLAASTKLNTLRNLGRVVVAVGMQGVPWDDIEQDIVVHLAKATKEKNMSRTKVCSYTTTTHAGSSIGSTIKQQSTC